MHNQSFTTDPVTISCYEHCVPTFVEAALDRLYQSLFSSLALFRVYGSVDLFNTYVAREAGAIIAVLLFRVERSRVVVCNEVLKLPAGEIARFAKYIFARFTAVNVISFRAVETDLARLSFPFQRFNMSEDIVLTLPPTVDEYLASLGKATRRTIHNHMNRLQRAYPSFQFQVFENEAIRESDILMLIEMNHARMAGKGRVSSYDEAKSTRTCRLARVCGLVGILLLDGRVCAGSVSFRAGGNYFMELATHDPQFDALRLGTLNSFLNISECIKRGGRECHLLWGQYDYKYRFRGVDRPLDILAVYRSRLSMLRHADLVLKLATQGMRRRLHCHLNEARHRDTLAWRAATRAANGWRRVRRLGQKETAVRHVEMAELPEVGNEALKVLDESGKSSHVD